MKRFSLVVLATLFIQVSINAQCTMTAQNIQTSRGAAPFEIDFSDGVDPCFFLKFSWRSFIAMNWPAVWNFDRSDIAKQTRGLADQTKVIGQGFPSEPTVWEMFQPNWYVFAVNNPPATSPGLPLTTFVGWNSDAAVPSTCGQVMQANASRLTDSQRASLRMLSSLSKFDAMPGVIQASGTPLIDQEGRYVRYEILTSFEAFDYLVSNKFYLAKAQEGKTISFPTQTANRPGAILIKAAWKVLTPDEEQSGRFHTARAFLFTPGLNTIPSTCAGPVVVGLVGLHVVQKTFAFPGWIWETFEHVDNTPDDPSNPGSQSHWSFWNRTSTTNANKAPNCPSGSSPCDWQPTSSHRQVTDPTGGPTQVVRLNPIANSPNQAGTNRFLDQLNQSVQTAFRQINPKSVWQFYRLVDAQWHKPTTPTGFFPPTKVANITMETYSQRNSCLACHTEAKAADGQSKADFTFQLMLGWDPKVLPPIPNPQP